MKTSKITQKFISSGFTFGGYLGKKTQSYFAAELAARQLWNREGMIFGIQRLSSEPPRECPSDYFCDWSDGWRAGVRLTLTKAGVKAALISRGHTSFPNALTDTVPSKNFIPEEMDFAKYLECDNDAGGAWNDDRQIDMHLK